MSEGVAAAGSGGGVLEVLAEDGRVDGGLSESVDPEAKRHPRTCQHHPAPQCAQVTPRARCHHSAPQCVFHPSRTATPACHPRPPSRIDSRVPARACPHARHPVLEGTPRLSEGHAVRGPFTHLPPAL